MVSMDRLISIIIPIYNAEKYLPRCIDSVLNQTYKNLEIILVDDGSPDNCGKICDEYAKKDNRIKVIHKQNGGVSSARNAGLDIAQGDYIGFIDPDDYIRENMYETLILEANDGNFDIVECNYTKVYEDGTYEKRNTIGKIHNTYQDILYSSLTAYLFTCVWNKIYKKSIIGETRFDVSLTIAEDMKFFFECSKKGAILKNIESSLYYYCMYNNSVTNKPFHKGFFDILSVSEAFRPDCSTDSELLNVFNSYYLINLIDISQRLIDSGIFIEKRHLIRKKITDNIGYILKFKPIRVNSKIRDIRNIDKLYALLICVFPVLVYWFYPKYLKFSRRNDA